MSSTAAAWNATVVNYSAMSATAFLLWDILVTLDGEVRLIWSRPNSFRTKWLFLFNRYFAAAFQLSLMFLGNFGVLQLHYSPRACVIRYIYQGIAVQILVASVEIVLIVRVRALYLHSLIVTRSLYTLFVLENACMAIALAFSVRGTVFDITCFIIRSSPVLAYFAAVFGSFEALLFALTLAKSACMLYYHWRDTPFLTVLVRDGTWAFALIFAALCVNVGFFLGATNEMSTAAYQWLFTIESFAGARLMLNMLALEGPYGRTDDSRAQVTAIRFFF